MVFESIVADLLNRYLGDYVENLDRKQLKIGIWGGKCDCIINYCFASKKFREKDPAGEENRFFSFIMFSYSLACQLLWVI